MGAPVETPEMAERVAQLLAPFQGAVCTADLLCDGHDPKNVAYRIVAADQSCETLTYGELTRQSGQCAAALASLGVGPGDRVATLMGKSRDLLIMLVGIWRLGAVHVVVERRNRRVGQHLAGLRLAQRPVEGRLDVADKGAQWFGRAEQPLRQRCDPRSQPGDALQHLAKR